MAVPFLVLPHISFRWWLRWSAEENGKVCVRKKRDDVALHNVSITVDCDMM